MDYEKLKTLVGKKVIYLLHEDEAGMIAGGKESTEVELVEIIEESRHHGHVEKFPKDECLVRIKFLTDFVGMGMKFKGGRRDYWVVENDRIREVISSDI